MAQATLKSGSDVDYHLGQVGVDHHLTPTASRRAGGWAAARRSWASPAGLAAPAPRAAER
jgi:hypothetical protein